MSIAFTNSKNSGTSNPHRLLLNISDKINMLFYETLAFTIQEKI